MSECGLYVYHKKNCVYVCVLVKIEREKLYCKSQIQELCALGMHDIYRTDKLSTDMGENDVIFIAPINK